MDQGSIIFIAAALGTTALAGMVAWGLSRRTPKLSSASTFFRPKLLKACGPVTAQQAVILARGALHKHTTPGSLRGISSGQDLNNNGQSTRWSVIFETHGGSRTGVVSFSSSTTMPGSALVVRIEILPTPPQLGEPLAELFEDSPAAMARLLKDSDQLSTKATLSVRPDARGNPVWRLEAHGTTRETPFITAA